MRAFTSAPMRLLAVAVCLCAGTATASSNPERAISHLDIELLSDVIVPRASAFAPGRVAWVAPGGSLYQIVLRDVGEGGREQLVDFAIPVLLGGGAGIAWLGVRTPGQPDELCVAAPDVRCAVSPASATNTGHLQVGVLDGDVVVWFIKDASTVLALRLDGDRWQELALPNAIYRGAMSLLPAGDGFLVRNRDGLTRWTRRDGAWVSEALPAEARGRAALSESQLLVYKTGPLPAPSPQLFLHDHRPPWPGRLHRIQLDGGGSSTVEADIGFLSHLIPHGREGALLVGSHQAEYWQGGERLWRLPSSDMSGASWEGHPWVSIGSTRMRLDADAIMVEDPVPGRFVWSERITPEVAACGGGHGLRWQHGDVVWIAWMADGGVKLGHACPEAVDPWPLGQITECVEGTLVEVEDHVACVAVSTKQYETRKSVVLLTRRGP